MIPQWVIIPLFIFSTFFAAYQQRKVESRHIIFNVRFMLAVGGLVMAVLADVFSNRSLLLSVGFFVLAVGWLLAAIRLWRRMPPKPPRSGRPGRA
jgi:hypothetical protein